MAKPRQSTVPPAAGRGRCGGCSRLLPDMLGGHRGGQTCPGVASNPFPTLGIWPWLLQNPGPQTLAGSLVPYVVPQKNRRNASRQLLKEGKRTASMHSLTTPDQTWQRTTLGRDRCGKVWIRHPARAQATSEAATCVGCQVAHCICCWNLLILFVLWACQLV